MMNSQQETKRKKNRKFKFKGVFRRKSKKKQSSTKSVRTTEEDQGDDSSVYSVNVETSSKMSASQSAFDTSEVTTPIIGDPIHVILLVMDPKMRLFELLQLEFDSASAKVADIFAQIAKSATEPSLKSHTYEMLVNLSGDEMLHTKSLAEYFDSAGIVIAVPSTTVESGPTIAKMANPILTNPRVHTMLTSSGLEIPDLPAPVIQVVNPKEESTVASSSSPPAMMEEKKASKKSKKFPFTGLLGMAILAVAIRLILNVHFHFTSPIGPGDSLAPGRSRGFCGLASLSPLEEKCESMTSRMGQDGVFQVVNGNGEVVYELTGNKDCPEGCVAGLFIEKDGKIMINGSRVKTTVRAKIDLKPWPFAEDVLVPKMLM